MGVDADGTNEYLGTDAKDGQARTVVAGMGMWAWTFWAGTGMWA